MGEAERARLAAMGSPMRRRQFIAGHWLARELAAESTGTHPHDWLLLASATGAPELHRVGAGNAVDIHVSLSHSGESVAVAIAPFPVGIDLEAGERARDWLALARYVFAPEECVRLQDADEADRPFVFYRYWTLKEASGKRDGTGVNLAESGKHCAVECNELAAVATTWEFDGHCVALAGSPGMRVDAHGVSTTAERRFWRFEVSGQG